jgi:FHA domain
MTETNSSADDLQCTNVLIHLTSNEASQNPVAACTLASEPKSPEQDWKIAQLEAELASTKARLEEKSTAANPFDMVLTLSSEREAALRERKLYKDRAANAEANVAQLESDLAAANVTAKLQTERANKLAVRHEELQRLLQERGNRILELEMQLTDHVGAPTLFGGELERHAPGAMPTVTYALESLDTPGKVHRLTHPVSTVGRGKTNDIPLDSPSVSRFHARLLNKPDGVWLVDLQSINGCHVNDRRTSSQILSEGDLVVIGECRFRFSVVTQSQSAPLHAADQATPSP